MTRGESLWVEVFAFDKEHGDDGPAFLENRIAELAAAGQTAEMEHCLCVGLMLERLYRYRSRRPQ